MASATFKKNIPYVKQQFGAALGNSSVVVKFLCASIFLCYFLSFGEGALHVLTVIPGNVMPPNLWIWTYFTHSFIERHIWIVAVDIIVIVLYGKLLEPLWGALEMLIFYLIVTLLVAVASTMTYLFVYLLSMYPDFLFDTHIHGLAGYVAGFSVAVKQVMPDHVLISTPFGKLRNKHIPILMFSLAVVVRLIGGIDGPYPIMFGWGLIISWIYLRFYQKHNNGHRGDMAESFSFASFFPDRLQPIVKVVSNFIFSVLVKIKICKRPIRHYNVSSPTTITVSLPGTDPQDAERRRQVALKALDERLAKAETNWPSMDEQETNSASSSSSPTETLLSVTEVQTTDAKMHSSRDLADTDKPGQKGTPSS